MSITSFNTTDELINELVKREAGEDIYDFIKKQISEGANGDLDLLKKTEKFRSDLDIDVFRLETPLEKIVRYPEIFNFALDNDLLDLDEFEKVVEFLLDNSMEKEAAEVMRDFYAEDIIEASEVEGLSGNTRLFMRNYAKN